MDLLYTVPAAIGLGALHALEPGHGKGVMTAYLISSKAKAKDALLLGVISAIAHTLSILLLAFVTTSTVKMIVPEQMSHWIELFSGIVIAFVGTKILIQHLRPRIVVVERIGHRHADHFHGEICEHHHDHGRLHHIQQEPSRSIGQLFVIGFFTGLIPCPSAIAIFLAAIAADKIPSGMGLVAAFSLGGAIAMSILGLIVIRADRISKRLEQRKVVQSMAALSSFLIISLGLFILVQSFIHLGFLS